MIERRACQVGIKTKIGNHSLRATGITDYLKSDGSLAEACKMANHADTRTTQLYDRRGDRGVREGGDLNSMLNLLRNQAQGFIRHLQMAKKLVPYSSLCG